MYVFVSEYVYIPTFIMNMKNFAWFPIINSDVFVKWDNTLDTDPTDY